MKHRGFSALSLPISESLLATLSANVVDKVLDAQREFPDVVVLGGHGKLINNLIEWHVCGWRCRLISVYGISVFYQGNLLRKNF